MQILAIDPGYSKNLKRGSSSGLFYMNGCRLWTSWSDIQASEIPAMLKDHGHGLGVVALDWIDTNRGVHADRSNIAGTIAVMKLLEVQLSLWRAFDKAGYQPLCIPSATWRKVSNWHTGMKRWNVKKKQQEPWGYDAFRLDELTQQGLDCKLKGLNTAHLRDAYTLALFAAGLNPAQYPQYRYEGE